MRYYSDYLRWIQYATDFINLEHAPLTYNSVIMMLNCLVMTVHLTRPVIESNKITQSIK